MEISKFLNLLKENKIPHKKDVEMKKRTTFKIGGKADVFISPLNTEQLIFSLKAAKECSVPYFILGKGSNLLVSDNGIEGAVIDMNGISGIKISDNIIECGAGESLRALCIAAKDASLTGLEFAYGIPGSVGGAFYMNAGAYGGEMKNVAVSAVCIDKNLNIIELSADKMDFSYRKSAFQENGFVILSVKVKLEAGDKSEISQKQDEIFKRRADKQPLDYPSAGSTFKRPEGNYAGTLIEQSGLKGSTVGGAMVSKKHAGFIINFDNATANDVLNLIENVKKTVKEKSGIELVPEVMFVGKR